MDEVNIGLSIFFTVALAYLIKQILANRKRRRDVMIENQFRKTRFKIMIVQKSWDNE